MIKIIFFGSSKHSVPVIKALHLSSAYQIAAVVTQPDRPTGRRQKLTPTEVNSYAKECNITLLTPETLRENKNFLQEIKKIDPDLLIVAYYGLLIPEKLLDIPKHGALNLHPSLLPAYRGSSPAQWAILKGERYSGITIIRISPKFDEGEIVAQKKIEITAQETPESFYDKSFKIGAQLLLKILPEYLEGKIVLKKQGPPTTEYARRLSRADGRIDWKNSNEQIERKIRAFYPWPGCYTTLKELGVKNKDKRIKILKAHLEYGKLVIDKIQVEGKKPINWSEFKKGYIKSAKLKD